MNPEITLVASALMNRDRIDLLLDHDPGELLNNPDAIAIFAAIREIVIDGGDPDLSTVSLRLLDREPERYKEIIAAISRAPVTVNFHGLLSEISRYKRRSRLSDLLRDTLGDLKNGLTIEEAAARFENFADQCPSPDLYASIKDFATRPLDDVFGTKSPIMTKIDVIDGSIAGLYPGQLVIIAARPGMGKSSLAAGIAANLSGTSIFFSLEMSRHEIYARRLSGLADVEAWRVETARLSGGDAARIIEAREAIKAGDGDIIVVDRVSDINRIISITRKFIRRGGVSAIFIDYLQLIAGGRGENQNLRIADITRRLKQAAMEYQVPVILLSQLNRNIEYRDREPVLSDLRDSGAIEQDADVVIFLHENKGGGHYIYFAKNRKGRIGRTEIQFEKRYTRFLPKEDSRMQNLCN